MIIARDGLPARLGVAAVVGVLVGATVLLAARLMPLAAVPIGCRQPGSFGCAFGGLIAGLLLGALLWLVVVLLAALAVGGLLVWLSGRLGVRLGLGTALGWPVALWAVAILVRPLGAVVGLKDAPVIGYGAMAVVLAAGLTAPQVRPAARLIAAGVLVLGVVLVLR